MLHIKETIIVEGKFDKEKLKKITDAAIICTEGFNLYRDGRIISSIKKMAEKTGIIILTDSDAAGFRIRNYIKNCLGGKGIIKHAYIPKVQGKERRKAIGGKEGILGVEGMTEEVLEKILTTVTDISYEKEVENPITKTDFFLDGLTGKADSADKRRRLAQRLGLPPRLSANALLEVINKTCTKDEYEKVKAEL